MQEIYGIQALEAIMAFTGEIISRKNMLVIHPKDKTTAMLSALYDGLEAQVVADCRSTKEMGHLLHHVSTQERIMLLGYGSDKGLDGAGGT